jgi:hypothetical protein
MPASNAAMKKLLLAALAAASLISVPARADERGKVIEAVMDEYLRLWNLHDAAAITSRIYKMDGPNGTAEGLQRNFDQLKAQGYDHSTKASIEGCLLSETVGLAEMRFTRWKTDGTPLGPKDRVSLYVLRKFPDGWRITELLGMDVSANLDCKSAAPLGAR